MKYKRLRRFGALALALVLTLPMAVTPAWADDADAPDTPVTVNVTGISLNKTTLSLVNDEKNANYSELLVCTQKPDGAAAKIEWSSSDDKVAAVSETGLVTAAGAGKATITAKAVDEKGDPIKVGNKEITATCAVNVREPIRATGLTLNQTSLRLNPGAKVQLTATVEPANADDKTVKWSVEDCDPAGAVTVENGLVSAESVNKKFATVTAALVDGEGNPILDAQGNSIEAKCEVYVREEPKGFIFKDANGKEIPSGGDLELEYPDKGVPNRLRAIPTPEDAIFTYESIVWNVVNEAGTADQSVIRVAKDPASFDPSGRSAVVTAVGPGIARLTITCGKVENHWDIEIPGITLRGNTLQVTGGKLSLWESQIEQLVVDAYGSAKSANMAAVHWESSDPSIVDVYGGRLTARTPGTVKVTARLDGYDPAELTVTVQEDTSALVQGGSVTAGGSVNLGTVASQLRSISQSKTGSALSYITNLSVATSQGILHDTHRSEADTGAGVGSTDRYYLSGNTTLGQMPLSDLSFVARKDYKGDANISYTGCTVDNQFFSGTIRVTVTGTSDVFYTAVAGQPLSFQADDFNRICQSKQGGRSLNYITFTLPQTSWGQLYYDYNGPAHPGQAVTSGTQYYRSRTPSLDRVSFVPSSTCPSSVAIAYRGMDANGGSYSGVVTISVTKQSGGDSSSDVRFSGVRGERVDFNAGAFNLACYNTIGEQLSYVRFGALPASGEGTLYINYWAPGSYGGVASANINYYSTGAPGLSTISFVSTLMAPDQLVIPYTGYGVKGTVYTGTVYIELSEVDQTGIRYNVTSGRTVSFNVSDFNNACINATGASLSYVCFSVTPTSTQGYLRYRYTSGTNYGSVSSSTQCYRVNPNSWSSTPLIGNVYFLANAGYVGTVTLPYTGYNTNGVSFTGEVVIRVVPNTITYTGTNADPLQISAYHISSACSGLMSRPVAYITLNNLPAPTAGRLYFGYTKLGTGTAADTGTRYYVSSSPSIGQLSFVPRGRYTGQVEVSYTAVSTSGEQVTGRIVFNIVAATGSSYFRDMGNYVWAASAVDYLYQNSVVNGIGNSSFGPNQYILRRDFILMLSRGFSFPAAGSYSFPDVPMNAYYARAVASAKYLGIVRGSGGYFLPASAITREDAMVMVYNTLIKMGKNPGSGGTALLTQFSDYQSVSGYAREAVGALVQMGAVTGSNGRLNPKAPITRAEAAVILHFVLTM